MSSLSRPRDPYVKLRRAVAQSIRREMGLWGAGDRAAAERAPSVRQKALTKLKEMEPNLSDQTMAQVAADVTDEVMGLGPIEALLRDPTVSEIMVNGPRQVFCERSGQLELTNRVFEDDAHIREIIDRILLPLGLSVDVRNPMADARLPDGSRVNVVIPPVSVDGSIITIRKFAREKITAADLVKLESITEECLAYLKACVRARLVIAVSGGTGSGKTTLLNVLSSFISDNERLVTIEDVAELQLQQSHVVRLETRQATRATPSADSEDITTRDLVRNALRMRPDRIIIGEVRGAEVSDLLQALNTGHEGSMTTLHANSPLDTLHRLETMMAFNGANLPQQVVAEMVARAIRVVVFVSRLAGGRRGVSGVDEVLGWRNGQYEMRSIFTLAERTGREVLVATGERSSYEARFRRAGLHLSPEVFRRPDDL